MDWKIDQEIKVGKRDERKEENEVERVWRMGKLVKWAAKGEGDRGFEAGVIRCPWCWTPWLSCSFHPSGCFFCLFYVFGLEVDADLRGIRFWCLISAWLIGGFCSLFFFFVFLQNSIFLLIFRGEMRKKKKHESSLRGRREGDWLKNLKKKCEMKGKEKIKLISWRRLFVLVVKNEECRSGKRRAGRFKL